MEEWKQRLRAAREDKGLSKTAFAAAVGVSNATATDWEKSVDSGGIKEISGPKLTRASEVLGVDPHWLLHGTSSKSPRNLAPEGPLEHPADEQTETRAAEEMLKAVSDMVETYRLASSADRERIDLVFREIRQRLTAVDQTKARAR
jgi:transcriptional regulator with XRE-family HTH domain